MIEEKEFDKNIVDIRIKPLIGADRFQAMLSEGSGHNGRRAGRQNYQLKKGDAFR